MWLALLCILGCSGPEGLGPDETGDTVYAEGLVGILVTPEDVVLPLGQSVQLSATGLYEDRRTEDLTAVVDWSSSQIGVAEVRDSFDAEGSISAVAVGSTEITATLAGVVSPIAVVKVTEATLDSLSVEPGAVQIAQGDSLALTAVARFSDGQSADASAQVRWVTADGSIAQLADGILTAAGVGTTQITAQWDEVSSNPVQVEVLAQAIPDLTVVSVQAAEDSSGFINVNVTLANEGTGGAAQFWADVFVDPVTPPSIGQIGDEYELVSYIGPGETESISFVLPGLSEGSHEIVVLADTNDDVEEVSESNNSLSAILEIDPAIEPLPNLRIDSFEYLADESSVYYSIEVSNWSDEPAPPFFVDVYLDSTFQPAIGSDGDAYEYVDGLDPWSSTFVEFLIDESCEYCWSWAYVDSYDDIEEWDETDNIDGPVTIIPD